jgi:hypothetical protein
VHRNRDVVPVAAPTCNVDQRIGLSVDIECSSSNGEQGRGVCAF